LIPLTINARFARVRVRAYWSGNYPLARFLSPARGWALRRVHRPPVPGLRGLPI